MLVGIGTRRLWTLSPRSTGITFRQSTESSRQQYAVGTLSKEDDAFVLVSQTCNLSLVKTRYKR